MSPIAEDLRRQLARAQSRLAYVRYVGANSEVEQEAHDLNSEAAKLVTEIDLLRERIKAVTDDAKTARGRG